MQHNDLTCVYCELITMIRLVSTLHLIQKQRKKEKGKKKDFPVMKTFRIYYHNFIYTIQQC